MEATHTETASYELRPATRRVGRTARTLWAVLAEVVVAGVRGDDFARTFPSSPGGQFAVLPTSSKQRLLDRGFRP